MDKKEVRVAEPSIKEIVDAAPQVGFNKFKLGEHTYARYPVSVSGDGRITHIHYECEPEVFTE